MNSSDFRAKAREKLSGKWGKVAIISLVFILITGVLGGISGSMENATTKRIVDIVISIIEVPLAFGITVSFFKIYKGEEVGVLSFVENGFTDFKKVWAITLRVLLKVIIPLILMIIGDALIGTAFVGGIFALSFGSSTSAGAFGALAIVGFILLIASSIWMIPISYLYQPVYLVAINNPELNSKEVVEKSAELMRGNRFKLFCLQLSFIGWAILSVITFGIGFIWVYPYMEFAVIAFYMYISGEQDLNVTSEKIKEENPIEEIVQDDNNNPIEEN